MKPAIRRMLLALGVSAFFFLNGCGGGAAGVDTPSVPASLSGSAVSEEPSSLDQESSLQTSEDQDAASPVALPEAGTGTVKWHPGHYVVFDSTASRGELATGLKEIHDLPFVRGIVLRAFWRQLEPQKDHYDFRRVDFFLQQAAREHKRFFMLLGTRYFRSGRVAPDYLLTPQYDGGVFKITSHTDTIGENITLWDNDTLYRLKLLIQALARRYDGNPYFEGLILRETAFGIPLEPVSDEKKAAYYANLLQVNNAARAGFQHTVVIRFVNFPYPQTIGVVNNLLRRGIGFGAPDVFLDDPDHEKYVYPFNDQVQGQIPIGMQVESDSYFSLSAGGPWNPPPVRDLYVFARDRLHSNYVFWQRDLSGTYRAWEKVLRMFRSSWFPKNVSGGLHTACPASYARCLSPAP